MLRVMKLCTRAVLASRLLYANLFQSNMHYTHTWFAFWVYVKDTRLRYYSAKEGTYWPTSTTDVASDSSTD